MSKAPDSSLERTSNGLARQALQVIIRLADQAVSGRSAQTLGTRKMSEHDRRPPLGIAHVVLETDRMEESARFMRTIGMRAIFEGPDVSVYELRGGTHLILMLKSTTVAGNAPFDLMVDDLHATRKLFTSLGLAPSSIEARPAIGHDVFTVREPAGHVITFFSSHVSGEPV